MDGIAPVSDVANRRSHPRRRSLKNALIVFKDGHCTMKCHILEVSDGGAKLVPADPLLCPSQFVLKPQLGPARECEVVWRKGTQIGVSYLTEALAVTETSAAKDRGAANDRGAPLYAPEMVHERAVLQEAVEQLLLSNKDRQRSCAFLVISLLSVTQITNTLDNRKTINDAVLMDIAWRLRACLRASDIIGRLSDDALGVVLPSFRNNGPAIVADKIRKLNAQPVTTIHGPVDIELDVEYVLFPAEGLTAAGVINRSQGETALARYTSLRNR
jgi:GGDEF domain-containing protein